MRRHGRTTRSPSVPAGKDALTLNGRFALPSPGHCAAAVWLRTFARARAGWWCALVLAASSAAAHAGDHEPFNLRDKITIQADSANRWTDGKYEIWALRGRCSIQQGASFARSQEAVLWIELGRYGEQKSRFTAYLEGDVTLDATRDGTVSKLENASWLGAFESLQPLEIKTPMPGGEPARPPGIYTRGVARRDPALSGQIRRTQYTQFSTGGIIEPTVPGTRRMRAFPRSDVPVQAKWFPNEARNEWVAVIDSGINLLIDGDVSLGTVDISADRIVIWTASDEEPDLTGQTVQGSETPLEIYMEGNLVFRQGERVIYAERMYYDVRRQVGTIIAAELLTPIPAQGAIKGTAAYQGLIRVKAQILQQNGKDFFHGQDAFVTTSRLGKPNYRFATRDLVFTDEPIPVVEKFTGMPLVDAETGEPVVEHNRRVTSRNNFVYVGPVPVFYWPVFTSNLENPTYYIQRFQFKQDQILGTQFLLGFDLYQLLNLDPVKGTKWTLNTDYFSNRGFAPGTTFTYRTSSFLGIDRPAAGLFDIWGLYDQGFDTLGSDRRNLVPENGRFRGEIFGQHRQMLPYDIQLTAELGYLSDRNVYEQYRESAWDNLKDLTTGVELKKLIDNMSFAISADVRLNPFFAETQGVRGDHFWLGQSLLGNWLTWYEHSQIGYVDLKSASVPNPAIEPTWTPLLWESQPTGGRQGERLFTTQEIDLPLQAGPVKVVPYGLGQLAHWGEELNGTHLERAYGQAGVRTSIPFWAANPMIDSDLFNVHGVAHKINFDAEYFFARSSADMSNLPLYDPLDDNATEHFRRRLNTNTFGLPVGQQVGVLTPQFDERFYALRSGAGSWVTSPTPEVLDDLQAFRLGLRQRWQTKRGMPGERRIIDWIVLDLQTMLYPRPGQDNYGQALGLSQYDFRWHVGDRTTLVSNGIFDFFNQGQHIYNFGVFLNRTPRTSLYAGYRSYSGVFESHMLVGSIAYRMSPKWQATMSTSVSLLASVPSVGHYLALTRIGESFLISATFTSDISKGNTIAMLYIEPRFLRFRAGSVVGASIPPAGLYGLE